MLQLASASSSSAAQENVTLMLVHDSSTMKDLTKHRIWINSTQHRWMKRFTRNVHHGFNLRARQENKGSIFTSSSTSIFSVFCRVLLQSLFSLFPFVSSV